MTAHEKFEDDAELEDDEGKPLKFTYDSSRSGWRHVIAGLVWVIICVCYADRTNIGIVLARHDFEGIPHSKKGLILSSFFIGYFFSQVPGGALARRVGAKPVFLLAAFIWTTCDVLTPLLADWGLVPLIMGRIGMGLGEGAVFPTQHTLTNFWIPKSEKAFLVSAMTSGQECGSVLANIITPQLLEAGLVYVFTFWALLAWLWYIVFAKFADSAPELHKKCVRSGEADWIQENRDAAHIHKVKQARSNESPFPKRLLREKCVWAIFAAHVGINYSWYIVLSWMPTFFADAHNLDLAHNPHILAIPYLGGFIGLMSISRISDKLIASGTRTRHVRKAAQMLGAVSFAVFLQLAAAAGSSNAAGVWMTLALFFGRMQTAGFWVNMVDVCPESAGTLMAMSNTIATIPGIIGQPITQSILDSGGSWAQVFAVCGIVGVVAAFIFLAFGDDVSLDSNSSTEEVEDATTIGMPQSCL